MLFLAIMLDCYRFMTSINVNHCISVSQDIDNDHPWLGQYADEIKKVFVGFPSENLMFVLLIFSFNIKNLQIE